MGRNVNADFHEKQTVNIKKIKYPQIEFSSSLLLRFTHQFEDCGIPCILMSVHAGFHGNETNLLLWTGEN